MEELIVSIVNNCKSDIISRLKEYKDSSFNLTEKDYGKWTVYAHLKKTNGIPFYIGICSPNQRHKRPYEKTNRNNFWSKIENKHERDVVILCDDCSEEYAKRLEKWYIYMFGKRIDNRGPLCNITDGGEGFSHKHSEETKIKMSMAKKGKTGYLCPNSHQVVINGKEYGSMSEAARELGLSVQTIKNRCDKTEIKNYYRI